LSVLALLGDYTVQNVLLGASLLGLTSGVLGSFAVLREQSLLGDTLSHAALPGIVLGFMISGSRNLGAILGGALVTGALAALFVMLLTRRSRLKTDAAMGAALSLFFALGVVLLTLVQNRPNASQAGLETFLFGQAAAILRSDLVVLGAIALGALLLVAALWKEFKVVTFDVGFAASLGLPVAWLEGVLTVMIALAVVVGLQMVGVVLMAAMVIAPAVAARQWSRRLETMVVLAAVVGVASGVLGALISALGRGLATGPIIILAASALVLISLLFAPERGLLWGLRTEQRNRQRLRTRRVLTTLLGLAESHDDPDYPAETGMLDAYHGTETVRALRRLEGQGLVSQGVHMPEEGSHWQLTERGRTEAEKILRELTDGSAHV
jgi:manganese/zinc/iron transport system permease protein